MSSSFGGGSQGQIKYQIIVDDTQVTQKLSKFKSSLEQINLATNTSAKNMNLFGGSFNATLSPIQKSGNALNQFSTSTNSTIQKLKSLGSQISNNITGFGLAAGGVVGLFQQMTQLHRVQVLAERSAVMLEKAHNKVGDLTIKLEKATAKYGATSREAVEVQKDLKIAQDNLVVVQERNTVNQERLNDEMASFATQILPNMIFAGTGVTSMLQGMGLKVSSLTNVFSSLTGAGSKLTGIIGSAGLMGAIGPLALAIAPLVLGLLAWQDASQKVNDIMSKIEQAKHIDNVTARIKAMNDQLDRAKHPYNNPLLDALFKLGPAAGIVNKVIDATKKQNEVNQNNLTVTGLLKTKQDEYNKALADYNAAVKTRGIWDDQETKKILDQAAAQLKTVKSVLEAKTGTDDLTKAVQKYNTVVGNTAPSSDQVVQQIKLHDVGMENLDLMSDLFAQQRYGNGILKSAADITRDAAKAVYDKSLADIKARGALEQHNLDLEDNAALVSQGIDNWRNLSGTITDANGVITKNGVILGTVNNTMKSLNDALSSGIDTAKRISSTWDQSALAEAIKKQMDDALNSTQSGLDRIIEAFHGIHKKGKLEFEVKMDKAEKTMNKFLANVAQKLDKGGSEGAKKYTESYIKKAEKEMTGAAKIQFQPIFDYVDTHKGEDAASWMSGFLQLLDGMDDKTKKAFTSLLIKDKQWQKFGKSSGDSWTKGFTKAMDDAKKEANKAASDIEKALGLSSGSLSFKIQGHQHGFSGLVTKPTIMKVAEHSPEFVNVTSERQTSSILSNMGSIRSVSREGASNNNQPIILNNYITIPGNEIVNDRKWIKRVKLEVGKNIDSMM